jgi:hypothetical protein
VHLLEDFLVEAFNAEEGALHPGLLPFVEIAEEEIDAGLYQPAKAMTCEEFDDGLGVGREIAEIFV